MEIINTINFNKIKCVVFDLDNTILNGTISENISWSLKQNILDLIYFLDEHGILMSIASKNDVSSGIEVLKKIQLIDYFLVPQFSYNPKSLSIFNISNSLKINTKNMIFIDDQNYELEEVQYHHPEISCINASEIDRFFELLKSKSHVVTYESKNRRNNYHTNLKISDIAKQSQCLEDFQKSIGLHLSFMKLATNDINRVIELDERVSKLRINSNKINRSFLDMIIRKESKKTLEVIKLKDKFGNHGIVGFYIIDLTERHHYIVEQLVLSCQLIVRNSVLTVIESIILKYNNENIRLTFSGQIDSPYLKFLINTRFF